MILPSTLKTLNEWLFVGPMGPEAPIQLSDLPTIAVDGGAHFIENPSVWVGDADSFPGEVKASHIYKHPIEKDFSDLALAFSLLQDQRHYKIHLWGFVGGRKDHELFNLGESLNFLDSHQECQVFVYGTNGKIEFQLIGAGQWKFTHAGIFSLGSLKKTTVRLTGDCKYQIKKPYVLSPLSSFGLSNFASGEITLENSGPVFIYYPEGK
jgi:thiamine pyrophosphokinase